VFDHADQAQAATATWQVWRADVTYWVSLDPPGAAMENRPSPFSRPVDVGGVTGWLETGEYAALRIGPRTIVGPALDEPSGLALAAGLVFDDGDLVAAPDGWDVEAVPRQLASIGYGNAEGIFVAITVESLHDPAWLLAEPGASAFAVTDFDGYRRSDGIVVVRPDLGVTVTVGGTDPSRWEAVATSLAPADAAVWTDAIGTGAELARQGEQANVPSPAPTWGSVVSQWDDERSVWTVSGAADADVERIVIVVTDGAGNRLIDAQLSGPAPSGARTFTQQLAGDTTAAAVCAYRADGSLAWSHADASACG
jgi:hypothetical protein